MYIGSAGPGRADGEAAGRTDGRRVLEPKYRFVSRKLKNNTQIQNICKNKYFLTFQITQTRKYPFFLFKTRFLNTALDPLNPPEMEHKLRLATHQQRAGGKDDGSLNKLPKMSSYRAIWTQFRTVESFAEVAA